MKVSRRELLQATGVSALALAAAETGAQPRTDAGRPIPLVHTTDLYHPPGDPDDHVDLATVFGLPEYDLRAVILDHRPFGGEGYPADPGFVPVVQLCYVTGRAVPVAVGPYVPLSRPDDPATDRPLKEQAGIKLLLRVLKDSADPVVVSVVGSARILTAAFNREPEIVRAKVRAVLLNAGSTGDFIEWNVQLDPAAYIGLFHSGLPIHWFPCATDASPFEMNDRNTYWRVAHKDLFKDLPRPLRAWFCHSYTGNLRGDIIRALDEQGIWAPWDHVMAGTRNLWSTASLVMGAGRVLAKTGDGWRFMPANKVPADAPRQLLALDPVKVSIADDGKTKWSPTTEPTNVRLYRREPSADHVAAMTEALNHLLCAIPV